MQVLQVLEKTYKKPREQLPSALTNETSIIRLAKEVHDKSRKKSVTANFEEVCQGELATSSSCTI